MEKAQAEKLFALINGVLANRNYKVVIDGERSEIRIHGNNDYKLRLNISIKHEDDERIPITENDDVSGLLGVIDTKLIRRGMIIFWQQFVPHIPLPIAVSLGDSGVDKIERVFTRDNLLVTRFWLTVHLGSSIVCVAEDLQLNWFLSEKEIRQIWDAAMAD